MIGFGREKESGKRLIDRETRRSGEETGSNRGNGEREQREDSVEAGRDITYRPAVWRSKIHSQINSGGYQERMLFLGVNLLSRILDL